MADCKPFRTYSFAWGVAMPQPKQFLAIAGLRAMMEFVLEETR